MHAMDSDAFCGNFRHIVTAVLASMLAACASVPSSSIVAAPPTLSYRAQSVESPEFAEYSHFLVERHAFSTQQVDLALSRHNHARSGGGWVAVPKTTQSLTECTYMPAVTSVLPEVVPVSSGAADGQHFVQRSFSTVTVLVVPPLATCN
jgi:hypothetical protein